VTRTFFGRLPDGRSVDIYLMSSETVELRVINYGCVITSIRVPDRRGRWADVVLGHSELEPYLENRPYLGATIGRYANRIAHSRFDLDGRTYRLATNDGTNHLHGGIRGFDQQLWTATVLEAVNVAGVSFRRTSPDGEEHYPGELTATITCRVTGNTVALDYDATTDAATHVNLTNHTYFNLAGEDCRSVLDHELTIQARRYTPVGAGLIPTGELAIVAGTPLDFRSPHRIGQRLTDRHDQLAVAKGYDHNWVLRGGPPRITPAARLYDPSSGRTLDIATTEPGLQFYDGHLLDGSAIDAYGRRLDAHAGLCLETQHFPDSPNQPHFPPTVLRPGQRYRSATRWRFVAG
jgi:aldose 1-epimerase